MNAIVNVAKSGRVNFNSQEPISLETLRTFAPSVFAEGAHDSRSERYMHISSSEIVNKMAEAGYQPFGLFQGGSRDEVKRNFTKHMIRFRHESMLGRQVGDTHYEVCLINSHDGTSTYRLMAGVFRLVCSNGLVVCDGRMHEARISHSIKNAGLIVEESERVLGSVPALNDRIGQLMGIDLSESTSKMFAEEANKRTAKILNRSESLFPFQDLLNRRREADSGTDLWTTMNVVQENIIQGGIEYVREGGKHKTGTTKSIRHLQRNVDVNRALWGLAVEFAEAA